MSDGRRVLNRVRAGLRRFSNRRLAPPIREAYVTLSLPVTVLFLFMSPRIRLAYRMTWPRRVGLAYRMWRTTRGVFTGTSYKAHLAMAVKLLEIPPDVQGVVVECGAFLGGSTANLSLICDIVDRDLIVYDSFEGLPPPEPNDAYARPESAGLLRGELEVVRGTVGRFGAIERCTFRKGWFSDTLPQHEEPIVLCFLDVDYQASLHDCVVNLWPHLTDKGYVFIDEYVLPDYCALFWSERWWREHFDTTPPGLLGSGTGVGVGQYYVGPHSERQRIQAPTSVAYTRKDFSGYWGYFPEAAENPSVPQGRSARKRS
jgi:hypothetical protein